ncbi:signal transduction histidine kinase [Krasilnikovia cinnamomea]|uniref:histidine kinase n=1 Tax=Krasilnikovia cinnamomea TaxID=349313 RepID=A0A4Q7ZFU5_9ACTN|nr:histidine kinase [Krasilnikovia cinnamomea]RZU49224.1 signal transduction histidine kinase [Krasilnikovia cinnamomea]
MGWVSRLFDARDTRVRMLLLDLSGVAYLVFGPHTGRTPTPTQWVLAVVAFTAALVLHRRPVVNLLVQTALLVVAFTVIDDATINEVGTSWALLEVTMAVSRVWMIWAAAAVVVAAHLVDFAGMPLSALPQWVLRLVVVVGLPVLFGLVIRTSRELARQAEERAAEQRRRHESEERAARAAERGAIARELHDVVAHHVASMVLRIGVAQHVLPEADPRVAEVFDDVHRTGTAALADLRRLVAVLRDPDAEGTDAGLTAIEPAALPAALRAAVDTAARAGLTVHAEIDPAVGTLDAVRGLAVLRLTQEALTNVAKHAGTSAHARLRVGMRDGDLEWEVRDDGGGTPPAAVPSGGHGLTGMRERVEVLGGRLSAGPAEGGWRVHTTLPATVGPA